MKKRNALTMLFQQHKKLFIIIGICLFLIELEIFAVAILKSGHKSMLVVIDKNEKVIYEADGRSLTEFNKYYFEKNFGPLENYEVKLERKEIPFPFRAWFSAAVGVPVGIVLLVAFIFRAVITLLGDDTSQKSDTPIENETKFEGFIRRVSDMNIFMIGSIAFLAILAYWVVPNVIAYIGVVSADVIFRFKWFFLTAAILLFILFFWFIYLRYLLAKKTIESKAEVEKHRLQLVYEMGDPQLLLDYDKKSTPPKAQKSEVNDNTIEGSIISEQTINQ